MRRRSHWYHPLWYIISFVALLLLYGAALWKGGGLPRTREPSSVELRLERLEHVLEQERVVTLLEHHPTLQFWLGLFMVAGVIVMVSGIVSNVVGAVRWRRLQVWWRAHRTRWPPTWSLGDVGRLVVLTLTWMALFPFVEQGYVNVLRVTVSPTAHLLISSTYLSLLIGCMLFFLAHLKGMTLSRAIGFSFARLWPHCGHGVISYVTWMPWLVGLLWLSATIARAVGYQPPPHPLSLFFLEEHRPGWLWYGALVTCLGAPLMEELFFRGMLFPALRAKCSFGWAAVLSGVLFGALHGNWVALLPITVLGVLLAYLYERTGTLLASLLVHALHNGIMVLLMLCYRALLQALGL